MNDKRCPACDMLTDEATDRCACGFVYWDDSPPGLLSLKGAGVTLFSLGAAVLIGRVIALTSLVDISTLSLGGVAAFSLIFVVMPNLRKYGGCGMSFAFFMVAVLSCFLTFEKRPPPPDPVVEQVVYNKELPLEIGGLKLGDSEPTAVEDGVTWKVDDETGTLVVLSGQVVTQNDVELLKVGDILKRVEARFPQGYLRGSFCKLSEAESMLVDVDDGMISRLALIKGTGKWGSGATVDGIAVGTTQNFSEEIKDLNGLDTHISYLEGTPTTVAGLVGKKLKWGRTSYKVGDSIDVVKKHRTNGYNQAIVMIKYDDQDRIKELASGTFPDGALGDFFVSDEQGEKLGVKRTSQYCVRTDDKNRALAYEEKWEVPGGTLTVSGPWGGKSPAVPSRRRLKDHVTESDDGKDYQAGERSEWKVVSERYVEGFFLVKGNYYRVHIRPDRDSKPDPALAEKFAQAAAANIAKGQ